MLDEDAASIASAYWANELACSPPELFAEPLRIVTHGHRLADCDGAFALFRHGAAIVSVPPNRADQIRPLLSGNSPGAVASALRPFAAAIIGPAYIGYATSIADPSHATRPLVASDAHALDAVQQSCSPPEWEHGGSSLVNPCSGVFDGDQLVAVAGYETWGGTIAHISVVTRPEFRGRGFGHSAVAHLALRAISAGLLPQYRTLESNAASIHIAESLGFHPYARSLAVRLAAG